MKDDELIALLRKAAAALDEEAAWLVDVDVNDRGQQTPSLPARDQSYFDAVTDTARSLRGLVEMVQARQSR